MELSATTMTTATPNNMASQQGTNNNPNISPTNNNSVSNTSMANIRPPNGNDSLQSHMQKQLSTNVSIIDSSFTTTQTITQSSISTMKVDSIHQKPSVTLMKNGSSSLDNGSSPMDCSVSDDDHKIIDQQATAEKPRDESISRIDNNNITGKGSIIPLDILCDDIKLIIETLIDRVETELMQPVIVASSQSSSIYVNESSFTEITSFITPILVDEEEDCKPKDIVTLRNLELTPPPQPADERNQTPEATNERKKKRSHSESARPIEEATSSGRSKRQRRQTQLFQVGDTINTRKTTRNSSGPSTPAPRTADSVRKHLRPSTTKRKPKCESPSPVPPALAPLAQEEASQIPPDVIFYEKNDYLAIRNEENHFYLCQLTENVRVEKPHIKIRWLDTKDGGSTYFLTSHYDMVPQKSIIMPVILINLKGKKKGQHLFMLDDQVKDGIMDRLRRSLNISEHEQ